MHIVLRSVVDNADVLLKTCVLTVIVLYVYTLCGMVAFPEAYGDACESFLSCFVFHFNFGLRSGGGIGDVIEGPDIHKSTPVFAFRVMFDVSFYFVVPIILVAIVSGVIIDTFGSMRDERKEKVDHMQVNVS
jgi:hypothetical protein